MNRIKLKFLNYKYLIQDKNGVVLVTSHFIWRGRKFNTTAIARCPPSIFDKEIGMKLARARAERRAYLVAKRDIEDTIAQTNKVLNILNNSLNFFNKCVQHQDNYINTF